MSGDQQFILALIAAFTAMAVALGGLLVQMRSLTRNVDGKMTQLLELTAKSSRAEGVIQGAEKSSSTK
jgi:hypothetical protein